MEQKNFLKLQKNQLIFKEFIFSKLLIIKDNLIQKHYKKLISLIKIRLDILAQVLIYLIFISRQKKIIKILI